MPALTCVRTYTMTDIYLYNTKTRTKGQQFTPIDDKNVRMYVFVINGHELLPFGPCLGVV